MSLVAKLVLSPLLVAQAVATRRRAPLLPEADGERHGVIGRGRVLRLLIVGDSSGAGVGVSRQDIALAGYLTRTLAHVAEAQVHWQCWWLASCLWKDYSGPLCYLHSPGDRHHSRKNTRRRQSFRTRSRPRCD